MIHREDLPQTSGSEEKRDRPARVAEHANGRAHGARRAPFYVALERALKRRGLDIEQFCPARDRVAQRVLEEYGAMYVASEAVKVPPVCLFESEAEVAAFQREATPQAALLGDDRIELQPAAMDALLAAHAEAHAQGLDITARGGAEAARRSFDDSLRLWGSRVLPALDHWCGQGRITTERAEDLRALPLRAQVAAVLEMETCGIFFSKDFSKSILYSVAAPGASQHLAMLALDVAEFRDSRVRRLLARQGWFQTIRSDLPHFTFLGFEEAQLPSRGLKRIETHGQIFWIPDTSKEQG